MHAYEEVYTYTVSEEKLLRSIGRRSQGNSMCIKTVIADLLNLQRELYFWGSHSFKQDHRLTITNFRMYRNDNITQDRIVVHW